MSYERRTCITDADHTPHSYCKHQLVSPPASSMDNIHLYFDIYQLILILINPHSKMSTTNKSNGASTAPDQQSRTTTLRLPASLATPLATVLRTTEPHLITLKSTLQTHPVLSTFLLCQLLCSFVPIALFLAGVAITASLAASAFACLALLVVGPILAFTSLLGVWIWGLCWAGWFVGRWFLGLGLLAEYSTRNKEVQVKTEENACEKEESKDKNNGFVADEKKEKD